MATSKNIIRDAYALRLAQLKEHASEAGKEVFAPFLLDLAAGFGGWYLGKLLGRKSLLIGAVTVAGGHYHGYREALHREEQRLGDAPAGNSKTNPIHYVDSALKIEGRLYHGSSPITTLGLGMMMGGAFAGGLNGLGATEEKPFTERAKDAWKEMKDDLVHRLYLDSFTSTSETIKTENKPASQSVNGIGEVQYFRAGDHIAEPDYSTLDRIEEELNEQAMRYETGKTKPPSFKAPQTKVDQAVNGYDADELSGISGTRIL